MLERFEDGEVLFTSVESQTSEFFLNSVANREGNMFSTERIISLQTEIGRLAFIVGREAKWNWAWKSIRSELKQGKL